MTDIVQYKLNSLISTLTTKDLSTKEHEIICIQINLLDSLINEYNEAIYYSQQDAYDDGYYDGFDEYYQIDELEEHRSLMEHYKQEEIDILFDSNHFTNGMGVLVIPKDSYWFTSDEIEAFRVIWQRRISAI
jgi:hypothetical protein